MHASWHRPPQSPGVLVGGQVSGRAGVRRVKVECGALTADLRGLGDLGGLFGRGRRREGIPSGAFLEIHEY